MRIKLALVSEKEKSTCNRKVDFPHNQSHRSPGLWYSTYCKQQDHLTAELAKSPRLIGTSFSWCQYCHVSNGLQPISLTIMKWLKPLKSTRCGPQASASAPMGPSFPRQKIFIEEACRTQRILLAAFAVKFSPLSLKKKNLSSEFPTPRLNSDGEELKN